MRNSSYTVELENFRGPLDVLLSLIERQKLDICDVSLATVTKDYLAYMQTQELDPHQTNWFLSIATKLILVKSKALLPKDDIDEVEEDLQDLTEQLQQLALYKKAAKKLTSCAKHPFLAQPTMKKLNEMTVYANISPQIISQTWQALLRQEKPTTKQAFRLKRQSNKQLKESLLLRLKKIQSLEISDIRTISATPQESVTLFMLILELIKNHQATLMQTSTNTMVEVMA